MRQLPGREIEGGEHRLLPLAHRKPADGIAVEADFGELLGADLAQILVESTLLDTKEGGAFGMIAAAIEAITAALGPAHAHFHARRDLVARAVGTRAFVERHHDVAVQQPLDFHAAFGRQHVLGPVDMAAELDSLLG